MKITKTKETRGRPKKLPSKIKSVVSIRLTDKDKNMLVTKYGSVQKAVNKFMELLR